MPNYGTYAICPYFVSEDPTTIKCEGIVKYFQAESLYHIKFPDKECKKYFMKCNCESWEWKNCPYASLLEQSYDDTGNSRTVKKKPIKRKFNTGSRETEKQMSIKL